MGEGANLTRVFSFSISFELINSHDTQLNQYQSVGVRLEPNPSHKCLWSTKLGTLTSGSPTIGQLSWTEAHGTLELGFKGGAEIMAKRSPLLQVLWTLLAVGSSVLILFDTLGYAAWNGVNFVMCLYLVASAAGTIGLLAGFCSAFSQRRFLKWVTCVSALAIVALSAIYAAGFIFGRTPGVPLSDQIYLFGRFRTPILLLYGVAFLCCLTEALLYFPRDRKLQTR